jgi:hypothetical protein
MYTASYDGTECKVFYNGVHIETWNKKVSEWASHIFLEHYLNGCKCLDCVVGASVNQFYNKGRGENYAVKKL